MVGVAFVLARPCKADNPWEDVKKFVQTNSYYNHFVTLGSGLYTYMVLHEYLERNKGNLDPVAQKGLSFGGAFMVSKMAQQNPGYTTLIALGLVIYNLLK